MLLSRLTNLSVNLVKSFKVPFYGGLRLHLRVLENFNDFVKHKWPEDFSDAEDILTTHATSKLIWPDVWLVLRYGDITHGAIAHENEHITLKVMRMVGMTECDGSEEAYCYFMGWLADTVYSACAKNNLKIALK